MLHLSDVLNNTSSTLNQVHHVAGSTVRCALTRNCVPVVVLLNTVPVFIRAHALQWGGGFTRTVFLVLPSLLFECRPDQKVPEIGRTAICNKGTVWKCFFQDGGYINDALMIAENAREMGEIRKESDH